MTAAICPTHGTVDAALYHGSLVCPDPECHRTCAPTQASDPTGIDPAAADRVVGEDAYTAMLRFYTRHPAPHGTYCEVPYISEVLAGRLYIGGAWEDSTMLLPQNIAHVVCVAPWFQFRIEHQLRSYLQAWLYDSTDQAAGMVPLLARHTWQCMQDGPTLVHCQAGINRSGLVAAAALIVGGTRADHAVQRIRQARSPGCLCNPAFERWVLHEAQRVLWPTAA